MSARTRSRSLIYLVAIAILVSACAWGAGQATWLSPTQAPVVEAAEANLALTVYNQGSALVRDRRPFELVQGFNEIAFRDVAASIDPTSVLFKSLSDPGGTVVLEQNYEYDLINSAALYQKYLDQQVELTLEDGEVIRGRLLSTQGGFILQDDSGEVNIITSGVKQVAFPDLPEGLITRPTLIWHLLADQTGTQDMEITYLTGGFSWQSDYVVLLNEGEDAVELDGWITLNNTSGTSYKDAKLKLIAGDLQRLPETGFAADALRYAESELASAPVEEREFFEYHLYEIPRPVSVRNNETKQIQFVSAGGVPADTFFVYDGSQCRNNYWYCTIYGYPQTDPSYGIASNPKVMVMLEFDSESVEADLPRGRVRVYQEDVDGAALLIGEDTIDHTPQGEILRLYIGDAFDIVGERVQTDFRQPAINQLEEDFEITLRNHKDEAVEVRVVEHLFRWSDWRMLRASTDFTELDSSTIEFRVRIPANGETTVSYSVRYFWP
jgi:hypothetical protein